MASQSQWLSKLKGIDAYPKTIEEFKVRTMQGGFFSVMAFLAIAILLVSEVSFYFATDTVDKMLVDGQRNTVVPIFFDVDFPKMPCSIIAVEKSDMAGLVEHDIMNNIEKIPLDHNGQPLKEGMRDIIGGALTNHTDLHGQAEKPDCGPCYSAGEEGQCCNTCDDVKAAYARKNWHLPSLHTIAQCQEAEIERVLRREVNEGCRIKGFLLVGKVAGKVYFAPSKYFRNGYLSAQDLVDATFRAFDTSHRINSLSFGDSFPNMKNPLDQRTKKLSETSRGTFQYFLKVVPTEYSYLAGNRIITNQYSVTEHFKELSPLSEKGLPMVSLTYSFSPIMFRIEEVRKGFLQFLTSVCAIVGGVFTIMGVLDSVAFAVLNKSNRRAQMLAAASPLPPEIWNLAVVLTVCVLLGWMARLLRLALTAADLRYAVASHAVLHLKDLGASLDVLRSASMWHFHQLLRTTTEATPTKMARLRIPFDVVSSSLDIKRVGGAGCSSVLNFEVHSQVPCTVQVFWGVQSESLDALASESGFTGRVASPVEREGASPRHLLSPLLRQLSVDGTLRALRTAPSRIGSRMRRQLRRHELRDDHDGAEDPANEVSSDQNQGEAVSPSSIPHFAAQSDVVKCDASPAESDMISVPISPTAIAFPAQEELQSLIDEVDSHSPSSTAHRGSAVVPTAPRFASVIVLRSPSLSIATSAKATRLFGKLSARNLTADATTVVCHCVAIDFLPTPVKPERFRPVVVKKVSYTRAAAYASQEIFGRDTTASSECAICLEGAVSIVLLPCRHFCVCRVCLQEIDRCPICRANFGTYVAYDGVDDVADSAPGDMKLSV